MVNDHKSCNAEEQLHKKKHAGTCCHPRQVAQDKVVAQDKFIDKVAECTSVDLAGERLFGKEGGGEVRQKCHVMRFGKGGGGQSLGLGLRRPLTPVSRDEFEKFVCRTRLANELSCKFSLGPYGTPSSTWCNST